MRLERFVGLGESELIVDTIGSRCVCLAPAAETTTGIEQPVIFGEL